VSAQTTPIDVGAGYASVIGANLEANMKQARRLRAKALKHYLVTFHRDDDELGVEESP